MRRGQKALRPPKRTFPTNLIQKKEVRKKDRRDGGICSFSHGHVAVILLEGKNLISTLGPKGDRRGKRGSPGGGGSLA